MQTSKMSQNSYQVPYICPHCDHAQWVEVDDDPADELVRCDACHQEDELRPSEG